MILWLSGYCFRAKRMIAAMARTSAAALGILALLLKSPANAQPKSGEEIFSENQSAIVHVTMAADPKSGGKGNAGSGFIIGADGFVLTAKHNLKGYVNDDVTPIKVRIGSLDGKEVSAQPIPFGDSIDVALLKLRNPASLGLQAYPTVRRGSSSGLKNGSAVFVVGFNLTSNNSIVPGTVQTNLGGGPGGELMWSLNAPGAVYGMSGGPVFDSNGRVVGIAVGGIPATSIVDFYPEVLLENFAAVPQWKRDERPPPPPPPPGQQVPTEVVAGSFSAGPEGDRIYRAFIRDVTEMNSWKYPITTDSKTTASIRLNGLDTAFLQGSTSLIKLQRIPITSDALQIKGPSHAIIDNGDKFEATNWVYVRERSAFSALQAVSLGATPFWPIPPSQHNRELYILAIYEGSKLLIGNKGYAGLRISDFAGSAESVQLFVGGKLKTIALNQIYFTDLYQSSLLYLASSKDIEALQDAQSEVQQAFAGIINYIRNHPDNNQSPQKMKSLLKSWSEATSTPTKWLAVKIANVDRNVLLIYEGKQ
jgi:Trypsin-like peptidase domain